MARPITINDTYQRHAYQLRKQRTQPARVRRRRERREVRLMRQEAFARVHGEGVSRYAALTRAAARLSYEFGHGSFYHCQKLVGLRK